MSVAAVVVAARPGNSFWWGQAVRPPRRRDRRRSQRRARRVAWLTSSSSSCPRGTTGTARAPTSWCRGARRERPRCDAGSRTAATRDIVVVHDAARPWRRAELFRAVVTAIEEGADAAIPGTHAD